MNRRAFLRGTLAGLAAMQLPMAYALPNGTNRKLVVFFNNGGWDPCYVFDPHLGESGVDSDPESFLDEQAGLRFISANSRPAVTDYFRSYAGISAVLNGVEVPSISHTTCTRLALTGKRGIEAPDLPTLLAAQNAEDTLLPHLVLSGPRFPGALGGLTVPLSPVLNDTLNATQPTDYPHNSTTSDAIGEFLRAEHERYSDRPTVSALAAQHEKRASFNGQTPFSLSELSTTEEQLDNLIAALQEGLCSSATLQCKLPQLVDWDSHSENHLNQSQAFDASFFQLKALIDRLHQTTDLSGQPLIESTTVMVLSEMGRTPKLNITNGKDHWPYTSMMLVGAGIRGGEVWGETDSGLVGLPVDPITGEVSPSGERLQTAAIHAGFLQSLGIDTSESFPGVTPFEAPFKSS